MNWDEILRNRKAPTVAIASYVDEYYRWIAANKVEVRATGGFVVEPDKLHKVLFPHQRDIVMWALARGTALVAASFGLGKTVCQIEMMRQVHQRTHGKTLIICPLGVKHQFVDEDGPVMGVRFQYVRTDSEALAADTPYLITNYERVRDGDITGDFLSENIEAVSLDEGAVMRSLGSLTQQTFTRLLEKIPYRFVCTATPSPNDYKELIYYADFLGIMDTGDCLTRWFKRDPQHAGHLTIHPHHERTFWLWVASWALFVQRPSDLGYSDDGYILPELAIHWHRVTSDHEKAWEMSDSRGQHFLFKDSAASIQQAIREKRDSLPVRVAKAAAIVAAGAPDDHWIIWHHLEDERHAITRAIPDVTEVYGTQDIEERERCILDFSHGHLRILSTKPRVAGSGCNLQRHCHKNIYVGVRFQFEEFIQSVHRTQRFGQPHEVEIHIIYTDAEDAIVEVMKKKWAQHIKLVANMSGIIREFGLTTEALRMNLTRSVGVERREAKGNFFAIVNNDTCLEAATLADDTVDLIHTSIPFGNHYSYVSSKNDFGYNSTDAVFWEQMDFLIPHLYRVLKPGRVAAIHVKDRLLYGHQNGLGVMSIDPFSDDCVRAFRKHGFIFMGRVTITTDVVRENNSTYRLTWSEMVKDGSKMGVGMPEYLLLFRKIQSDISRMYADEPVIHTKEDYPVSRWQIDAHSFWRSDGNRMLTPHEVAALDPERLTTMEGNRVYRWYAEYSRNMQYDYQQHLSAVDAMDEADRLPKTYGLMLPQSPAGASDFVWTDVVSMRTLNTDQSVKGVETHVCPLPFDIVDRVIERWSNPGELVYDPFGGLGTVAYRSIKLGRIGMAVELSPDYYQWAVKYCQDAEAERQAPTLFDILDVMQPEMKIAA
jgi:DNA modification methylase